MPKPQIMILATVLALTGASAFAQHMYRCTDSKGKPYFTDRPPIECTGKEVDELSTQGIVVKKRPAALTPEQYAAREARKKREKEEAIKAKEQARQDQALLATYSSLKEIEGGRQRALKQPERTLKDMEARIEKVRQRAKRLAVDKKSYANKPIPETLREDIKDNESDLETKQEALAAKKKDISDINAKYDQIRQRYLKLTTVKPKAATPTKN